MALDVNDVIAGLDPARRRKVRGAGRRAHCRRDDPARAAQGAAAHPGARGGRARQSPRDGVSRLEQRSDLLLSTLRRAIEAMGGSLSLVARFPDRPPVELSGIAERVRRD